MGGRISIFGDVIYTNASFPLTPALSLREREFTTAVSLQLQGPVCRHAVQRFSHTLRERAGVRGDSADK
jgi:hypothetical protein